MEWKIGCSGYHYPDWKRVFYPDELPQKKWFEYYCTYFNTLELNGTYYKVPRLEFFKKCYSASPQGFTFTVKAPRNITDSNKFTAAQKSLQDFNAFVTEGLGEKLGCVLFQFPANFQYELGRLERLTAMLDSSIKSVLEFRHASWWQPQVYDALAKSNISFCGMSHPTLPESVIRTTERIYYRFQGVPHLYNSKYESAKLEQFAQELLRIPDARQAHIYFNNTADGHAVTNARQLQDICELVARN
jgi:uncharacterized protein YecE (DUF72 family)